MALKLPYEISCSCGKRFQADIYEYVFTEYDPELKDMILAGEFNCATCPSCKERLNIENRFLYRDEKNRLWIWVCKKEEELKRERLKRELIDKNTSIKGHFLDDQEEYRKFLAFGREGLIELLLKEDKALKRIEEKHLKKNPAIRLIIGNKKNPGYLFLNGNKIKISLILRFSHSYKDLLKSPKGKERWLKFYSQGINIHNPYSSFLHYRSKLKWNKIREREPIKNLKNEINEFDDFAESWAGYKVELKRFKEKYPIRYEFLKNLKTSHISRKIITYKA